MDEETETAITSYCKSCGHTSYGTEALMTHQCNVFQKYTHHLEVNPDMTMLGEPREDLEKLLEMIAVS